MVYGTIITCRDRSEQHSILVCNSLAVLLFFSLALLLYFCCTLICPFVIVCAVLSLCHSLCLNIKECFTAFVVGLKNSAYYYHSAKKLS